MSVIKTIVSCHHPKWVYNKYTHERVMTDCGYCPACLNKKHLRHVDLMVKQSKLSKYAYFFTLTYDDVNVPKLYFNDARTCLYNSNLGVHVNLSNDYEKPTREWLAQKKYVEFAYYKDVQLFLKRFRQNVHRMMPFDEALNQFAKYGNYEKICYYISSEYGPSTIRPHYHGIMFFNSDWLAKSFTSVLFKSWTNFDKHTFERSSKGWRTSCRPVDNSTLSTFAYTAAYCAGNTALPQIFECKELRPKCSYSKTPLLGVGKVDRERICQFVYNGGLRQFDGVDKNGQSIIVRTPRAFENRYMPKCQGFSVVDFGTKLFLYSLPIWAKRECGSEINYDQFCDFLSYPESLKKIEKTCPQACQVIEQAANAQRPFYGLWLVGVKFNFIRCLLRLTSRELVKKIVDYYSLKEYYRLRDWYEFMENFSAIEDVRYCYSLYENAGRYSLPYQESSNYKAFVNQSTRINTVNQKSKKDRDYRRKENAVVFNP